MPYDPKQQTYDHDHHQMAMDQAEQQKKKDLMEKLKDAAKKMLGTQETPQINRNESDQMKELYK